MRLPLVFVLLLFGRGANGNNIQIDDTKNDLWMVVKQMVDITLKHHPHESQSEVLLFGYFPTEVYITLMSENIDLVIMNPSLEPELSFSIPIPVNQNENYVQNKVGFILIHVDNANDLAEALLTISKTIFWNVHAKFICHITNGKLERHNIFFYFWWYKSIDCIVLEVSEPHSGISCYKYNPFVVDVQPENENQFGCWSDVKPDGIYQGKIASQLHCNTSCTFSDLVNLNDFQYLQTCLEVITVNIGDEMFPEVAKDLKGYGIKVLAKSTPFFLDINEEKEGLDKFVGKEAIMLKVLAEKMNFSVNHKPFPELSIYDELANKIINLQDLSFRKYDFDLNMQYLLSLPFPLYDGTYPIEFSGSCFLVHKAGPVPLAYNLLKIFDRTVFTLMILMFNFVLLNFFIYIKINKKLNSFKALESAFIYSLQLFLSSPVNWVSKVEYLRLLFFIIFWLIFFTNFIFQGLIVSFFTIPSFGKEIDTFEQLFASNYSLEGQFNTEIFQIESTFFEGKNIVSRTDPISCVKDILETNQKGCWIDCLLGDFVQKKFRNQKGNLVLHLGKERVHSFLLVYALWRDSPFTERMNYYMRKLSESGLLGHWKKTYLSIDTKFKPQENFHSLNLENLQGCFYMLAGGYVFALIVYALEILLANKKSSCKP